MDVMQMHPLVYVLDDAESGARVKDMLVTRFVNADVRVFSDSAVFFEAQGGQNAEVLFIGAAFEAGRGIGIAKAVTEKSDCRTKVVLIMPQGFEPLAFAPVAHQFVEKPVDEEAMAEALISAMGF